MLPFEICLTMIHRLAKVVRGMQELRNWDLQTTLSELTTAAQQRTRRECGRELRFLMIDVARIEFPTIVTEN